MKKVLSVLLALSILLMPLTVQSEAIHYDFKGTLNDDAWIDLIKEVQGPLDKKTTEIIKTVIEVVNLAEFGVDVQEDGFRFTIGLDGEVLADLKMISRPNEMLLSTSILPDYVFSVPVEADASFLEELVKVDWSAFAQEAQKELQLWANARMNRIVTTTGVFTGCAYTGGTMRETLTLTDADFADLIDGMLLVIEQNDDVMDLLHGVFGEKETAGIIHDIRRYNRSVSAAENQTEYELSIISKADELVGISLNIYGGLLDKTAVSVGENGNSLHMVACLANNQTALWADATVQGSETSFSFAADLYCADDRATWFEVAGNEDLLLERMKIDMDTDAAVDAVSIDFEASAQLFGEDAILLAQTGTLELDLVSGKVSLTETLALNDRELLTIGMKEQQGEEFTAPDPNTKTVSIETMLNDHEQLEKDLEQGVILLGIRALQHLPPKLILRIIKMGLLQ